MKMRTSVVLDGDVVKLLRKRQTKQIVETQGNVSFSRVINDVIREKLA